jgi:hypothetical protein
MKVHQKFFVFFLFATIISLFWRQTPTPQDKNQPLMDRLAPLSPEKNWQIRQGARTPASVYKPLPANQRPLHGVLARGVDPGQVKQLNRPQESFLSGTKKYLENAGGDQLSQVEIEPHSSYTIVEGDGLRHVEKVAISAWRKDGRLTRFFAEVDSESGFVLKTWGHLVREPVHRH